MREYKFRAWDFLNKRMFYPSSFNGLDIINGELLLRTNTILMQYTGLNDENGKEIYEGDLLEDGELIFEVFFENGSFLVRHVGDTGFMCGDDLMSYCDTRKVIGNIYENPELLEVQKWKTLSRT